MDSKSIVYVAFNNISENNSVYIGKTKLPLDERKFEHEKKALNNPRSPFHKALNSYGIENFSWYELMEVNISEVNNLEKFYIKEFIDDGYHVYNITMGGDGGDTLTNHPNRNNIIDKMRKAQRQRHENNPTLKELCRSMAIKLGYGKWMANRKLSDVHKNNIRKGIQIALMDKDKRDRISHKGQKKSPFTDKHKENLSKAAKNKPKSPSHCENISNIRKNQRWIYNEAEQRSTAIAKEKVDDYLLKGWVLGRGIRAEKII